MKLTITTSSFILVLLINLQQCASQNFFPHLLRQSPTMLLTTPCKFDKQPPSPPPAPPPVPSETANVTRQIITSRLICDVWNISSTSWQLGSPKEAFFKGGPETDADDDALSGYLVIDLHSRDATIYRVCSVVFPPTSSKGVCFSFEYSMSGLGTGGLRLVLVQSNENFVVNETTENYIWENYDVTENGEWKKGSISFTSSKKYQICFEGVPPDFSFNPGNFRGYIAVDNTQISNDFCMGDCNFDVDTCAWSNSNTADSDWKVGWKTANSNTGPLKDRSTAGGFLFIDSTFPHRSGDRAQLVSPVFQPNEPLCLHFWVSEFGTGIGNLSVKILPQLSNTSHAVLIWSVPEPLGGGFARDIWYPAQVSISYKSPYQVIIEASIGSQSRGNIAVDDLSIQPGACAALPAISNRRAGECAFVDDKCNWSVQQIEQPAASPDLWKLVADGNQVTQPKGHTILPPNLIDGYLKFDTNNFVHQPLDRAWVVSPSLPSTDGTVCLSFWVFMSSPITSPNGLGSLQVIVLNASSSASTKVIWRLENHQQPRWIHAQVPVASADPFQIAFEGIRGSQVLGIIAIDDIAFYLSSPQAQNARHHRRQSDENPPPAPEQPAPGAPAPEQPAPGPPAPEQPAPGPPGPAVPGQPSLPESPVTSSVPMIPSSNGNVPGCAVRPQNAWVSVGDCAFDYDTCGWISTGINTDVTWQLANPSKSPANVNDHTYNINQAGFVFFDPFTPSGNPVTSYLSSPTLRIANGAVCFTFWYMFYGNDMSAQLVTSERGINDHDTWRQIWKTDRTTPAPQWHFAQVELGLSDNMTDVVKLRVEATSRVATLVIDDIRIYPSSAGKCRTKL